MQRYRVVIMLVLFGVLPVVVAFFVALSFLEEQEVELAQDVSAPTAEEAPPSPEPPQTREVLVAARALPVGTLLGKDDLTRLSIDVAAVDEDHVAVNAVSLAGYVVRRPLAEGAPLTWSAVVGSHEEGFLAAVLRPGARAVTVRVGPATAHAGLIDPGDRVDVILSAELAVEGAESSVHARTIVEDVRVVAIDRRVGSGADLAADSEGEEAERAEITTATLEASPAQADRLVLGDHEGWLSLVVRSLAEGPAADEATVGDAVDLGEMLLSSSQLSRSKARLRRVQELNDLSVRTRIVESKAQLRAATQGSATTLDSVRVFRGSEPAEEVVFEHR